MLADAGKVTPQEAPFGFQRRAEFDDTPTDVEPPGSALERETAARRRAEAIADRLAAELAREHQRRLRAEQEASRALEQIDLARAHNAGLARHRGNQWRGAWRRLRIKLGAS